MKTAANWQAFPPQTLASTANVLLALQSVSGAIQFLGIGGQNGDSG
jgi:hypothetical protein